MAEYVYKALDANGKTYQASIIAEDLTNALRTLKSKDIYVLDIKEKSALQKEFKLSFTQKASTKDLAMLCRQFATMLMAGITILNCLDVLRHQYKSRNLGKILDDIYKKVEKGTSLSNAMREHSEIFPQILINMIEAGEVSGSIDRAMDKMAQHFEKEMKLKQKITNALMYPAIVILVAIGVLNVLMIFVIPTFIGLFSELQVDLPATTKFVISASKFMQNNWYYILALIIIIVFMYKLFKKSPNGAILIGRIKLKIPIIKGVILGQITSRFTRTLGTLINSGVPLITALDTTKKVISNAYIEKAFDGVIEKVKGGEGLSYPIEEMKVFPQLVTTMIRTGEETGRLEYMLERAADYYENEVENQVTRLTAMFEPVMIVFLALLVGFLLASIIMPMFKLYGNVG
ncbi:type II secretion system F family protein [Caldicellulosiruptoraceae bacterium PP1]